MKVMITPKRLSGTLSAKPSKSQLHRALICDFLTEKPIKINVGDSSIDIETTRACLASLKKDEAVLDCKQSGSTLRFLLPLSSVLKGKAVFSLSKELVKRPIEPLLHEMSKHGVQFDLSELNKAEIEIKKSGRPKKLPHLLKLSGHLTSGTFTLPGDISTQYVSGLMFALPLLEGDSIIRLTSPLKSPAYVEMTINMLKKFGIEVESTHDDFVPSFTIKGGQKYIAPKEIVIEGDWGLAANFIAAGAINGAVSLLGLDYNSLQGDKDITEILKNFSAFANPSVKGVVTRTKDLFGTEVDISDAPDLMPIISVVAAAAYGDTKIYNGKKLRFKESDRIKSMAIDLNKLGGRVEELPDGLIIHGNGKLVGGEVSSFDDHRIAMALSIASCICEKPVILDGAESVAKSYPKFFEDFIALGGNVKAIK